MRHLAIAIACAIALTSAGALADPDAPDSPTKQASEHFERGVAIYNEADYRAALVEFKKAYELVPNAAVLYNLGQTYYQLQNYAQALVTFRRYLAESGTSPSHEQEVVGIIKTLESRVGKVMVATTPPGAEITVDDELAGKTPLTAAIDVSIGHRKITALRAGSLAETRYVDVAAGDTVTVQIDFAPVAAATGPAPLAQQPLPAGASPEGQPRGDHHALIVGGWIATGVLAAGAAATGAFAWHESNLLADERNTFPASASELNTKSNRVVALSAVADGLTAAAIVAGGVSLYFTLTRSKDHEVRAALLPGGAAIAGSFR